MALIMASSLFCPLTGDFVNCPQSRGGIIFIILYFILPVKWRKAIAEPSLYFRCVTLLFFSGVILPGDE